MYWRFTILNNRTSVATVIDEPAGWDKNVSEVKRDPEWHGIFFLTQGDTFEYYDTAMRLLKAEYDQYGVEGDITLIIEQSCKQGVTDSSKKITTEIDEPIDTEGSFGLITEDSFAGEAVTYEEYSRAKFDFSQYEFTCGDTCFVRCPVENVGQTIELRNRINQKVNLDTAFAFDQTTALPPYAKLNFGLNFPSKGVLIQNKFEQEKDFTTPVAGVPLPNDVPGAVANIEWGMIEIGMDKQIAAEIGNSGTLLQPQYDCVLTHFGTLGCNSGNRFTYGLGYEIAPLDLSMILTNYQEGTPNYGQITDVVDVDIHLLGNIKFLTVSSAYIRFMVITLPLGNAGTNIGDYVFHTDQLLYGNVGGTAQSVVANQVVDISANYTNANFVLNPGDRVWAFYLMYHRVENSANVGHAFDLNWNLASYVHMKTLTHTPATVSKVYAVNEALSRITESITNYKLRAYSEYFGRTDSQPYSHVADGCGSLEVITDGLRIRRQENKIPGKPNLFSLSLQDMFDGLNPIHHIGMGIEIDSNRAGYNRLRVERWDYFYNTSVAMSCVGIDVIKRKVFEKEIYSTFQFGYAKWEAEEYNGLDEFLTKRSYRTTLSQIKNDLVKLSKFIGSGYALEITRRKGNDDSKDWRYDKDTFITCCKRGGGTFTGEVQFYSVILWIFPNIIASVGLSIIGAEVGDTILITGAGGNSGTYTVGYIFNEDAFGVTTPITTAVTGGVTVQNITPGKWSVELGNITSPQNIIDPPTIYNWRISPIRNAMRWMNKVLESYKQFGSAAKIIFTDGDGNYYAEGLMTDPTCRLEDAVIAENDTISPDEFADIDDAKPFLSPERVSFEYPMSVKDYKQVVANPYGLIYFQSSCEEGYGYIDSIKYMPEEGTAKFILIPKIF